MDYDYTGVIATYLVPYGCTVYQHVCVHFLQKTLRPKVRQTPSQMLDCVIILYDNALIHILQRRVLQFFRNVAEKCSTIHNIVLI